MSPLSENQDKQDPHPMEDSASFLLQTLMTAFLALLLPPSCSENKALKAFLAPVWCSMENFKLLPPEGVWELTCLLQLPTQEQWHLTREQLIHTVII